MLFATCPMGLEGPLSDELRELGVPGVEPSVGGVSFTGGVAAGYRACLWSRVTSRVLLTIGNFDCGNEDALYDGVRALDWAQHLGPEATLAVDFSSTRSAITHTHFGALKTKDAIVDRLRDERGHRPSVDTRAPDVRVNVHVADNRAEVAINLSGESLHRRGYRLRGAPAPLKENLAAGMLRLARWPEAAREGRPFLDPLCGSGTLVIEAAAMAAGIAPGLSRTRFGFHGWAGHDEKLWQELLAEARDQRVEVKSLLVGRDADGESIRAATAQAARAGVPARFEVAPLSELAPVGEGPGVLVTNPPYDERLSADESLYREMGNLFRRRLMGWETFVLAGNSELAGQIGLKPRRRHVLFNGAIECRLLEIPIASEPVKSDQPAWRQVRPTAGAPMFENRLRKNFKHWSRWAEREGISCYRVYDANLPEYAVAVDIYEDAVHVQEYQPPATVDARMAELRLHDVMRAVPEVLGRGDVFLKVRRRQKRGAQYQRLGTGGAEREVREGGHRFLVNLEDFVDTGLYLDHRRLRSMIGELARGRRFLNLFAYTATATVYAAKGGALSTTSVDLSNTYLDWAARNFRLNGVDGELERADVLEWLPAEKRRWGLIFLAPPTFSNSKRMEDTLEVQRDHTGLIAAAARLLTPDGILLFSNHFRRFKMEAPPGLTVENLNNKTLPKDFARSPRIHNAWRITSAKPPKIAQETSS